MKYFIIAVIILIIPWTVSTSTPSQVAEKVINSLQTEPHKWRGTQYYLIYFKDPKKFETIRQSSWDDEADCAIWIANQAFGVEIKSPQKVVFSPSKKAQVWKIYQKWASIHFATKVFNADETFDDKVPVVETSEQNIKESDTPLAPVTMQWHDRGTPVTNEVTDSTWMFISIIQFAVIILMMVLLFYVRRHSGIAQ